MMARRPEDRFPTARELLREIARLREGMSGAVPLPASAASLVDVELVQTRADGGPSGVLPSPSAATVAAEGAPGRSRWPRWLSVALFGVSVAVAGLAGVALARVRSVPVHFR